MTTTARVERPGKGMFGAIVWKETREALKPATVALAIVTAAFLINGQMVDAFAGLSLDPPPLVSWFTPASIAAALFLGLSQMSREHRGDRWALLTHRPVSRPTLYWGKVAAGVSLYLAVTVIPATAWFFWRREPSHSPTPFEARLMLPYVTDLLFGLVFYFTALLITMRRARWYGSRFLPLLATLVAAFWMILATELVVAVLIAIGGIVIAATAARGVFVSGGFYERQPRTSRISLGLSVALGMFVVVTTITATIGGVLYREGPRVSNIRSTIPAIARDGSIVRATFEYVMSTGDSPVVDVRDFEGRSIDRLKDSVTRGGPFGEGVISTAAVPINASGDYPAVHNNRGYRDPKNVFVQFERGVVRSYYYINRLGLVAVYDNNYGSHRIGWLGPDGFLSGDTLPTHRFVGSLRPHSEAGYYQTLIVLPRAVYRLDVKQTRVKRVFTAPAGEEILGAAGTGDSASIGKYGPRAQFDAIATTKHVYVQSRDGTPELTVPLDPRAAGYGTVTVSRALLASRPSTYLWYKPRYGTLPEAQFDSASDYITEFASDTSRVASVSAKPEPQSNNAGPTQWPQIVGVGLLTPITSPAIGALRNRIYGWNPKPEPHAPVIAAWVTSAIASLAFALLAFVIGRRYAFSARRLVLWSGAGFLLGPLGVLLMLSLLEWPARVSCPSCGRNRIVTRECCEHCGSEFSPPPVDGTEILVSAA